MEPDSDRQCEDNVFEFIVLLCHMNHSMNIFLNYVGKWSGES